MIHNKRPRLSGEHTVDNLTMILLSKVNTSVSAANGGQHLHIHSNYPFPFLGFPWCSLPFCYSLLNLGIYKVEDLVFNLLMCYSYPIPVNNIYLLFF